MINLLYKNRLSKGLQVWKGFFSPLCNRSAYRKWNVESRSVTVQFVEPWTPRANLEFLVGRTLVQIVQSTNQAELSSNLLLLETELTTQHVPHYWVTDVLLWKWKLIICEKVWQNDPWMMVDRRLLVCDWKFIFCQCLFLAICPPCISAAAALVLE